MPSSSSPEEEVVKKRAPRKRAATPRAPRAPRVAAPVAEEEEKPKAPRRRKVAAPAPRATQREPEERVTREERKAPTPLRAQVSSTRRKRKQHIIVASIFILGIGASAAVGFSDQGVINVTETIEARNERLRSSGNADDARMIVPVQNTSGAGQADGGFVGLGDIPTGNETPEVPAASSTATTTDMTTGSSTESVASSTEATQETASSSEPTS